MAQPSDHAPELLSPSFSVFGLKYIAPHGPHPLEVTIEKFPCKTLVITDINHKILFKVKPHDTSLHRQRLMFDADDKPIVMLREKNLTMHKQWEAFRGDSNASSNMIFNTKTENLIQFKTRTVSVMLANKSNSNNDCDLKIEGSWKKKNFTIGDSSKKKKNSPSKLLLTMFKIKEST
ncbi:putative tubby-like protein [Helianthus annuus]|nr:putative tubby-like protein [Helianthus annuus]